ncbi:MAG: integrin alpha, partial [Bacteroidota bacterium]
TASLLAWLNVPVMAQFPATFEISSLDGSNGFTISNTISNSLGSAVSDIGDVNGDGIADFILGTSGANSKGSLTGGAYVVFGDNMGSFNSGSLVLSDLDGSNGFVINGAVLGDRAGNSVSSLGDINGDLIDDFIIGAFNSSANGNKSGAAYVVFGNSTGGFSSGVLELSALNGSDGFILEGATIGDQAGASVGSAGDLNGDGLNDLVVGSEFADPNGGFSGASHVVFGNSTGGFSSGVIELSALNGTNGFVINGIASGDESGDAVAYAGDVNGDGLDDLIVGAPRVDILVSSSVLNNVGAAYVVFGDNTGGFSSGTFELSDLNGTNGFAINGYGTAQTYTGRSVSGLGDLNGDGVDDVLIGAYGARPNGAISGRSYVVFGSSTGAFNSGTFELSNLDGSNGFITNGESSSDQLGLSVSGAGDVNNDGINDLIVGAFGDDTNGNNAGASYLIFGNSTGGFSSGVLNPSDLDGSNGFTILGIDMTDYSGQSVSGARDVNGDGIDDLLVGASFANPNATSFGASYIIFGQQACSPVTPEVSLSVSPSQTNEDGAQSTLTFTFSASLSPTCSDLSINFSVSGTAIYNNDYFLVSGSNDFNGTMGTVTIPQGQTSVDLVFQIQQDAVLEPNETIIVTVQNP